MHNREFGKRIIRPVNPFSDRSLESGRTQNVCKSFAEELERVLANMPTEEV